MTRRSSAQQEALDDYLRACNRYDREWADLTNVQLQSLRNELQDAYRRMAGLVTIKVVHGKSEGITAAMRRTYSELLGK